MARQPRKPGGLAGGALLAALGVVLLGAIGAPAARAEQAIAGGLRGTVTDADFDTPLAGARVTIVEAFLSTLTNAEGTFVFERVPPGTYTLSITRDGYERQIVPDVIVAPGQLAEVRVPLSLQVEEMEEMVVKGEDLLAGTEVGLLEIRSEAIAVQDAISSEIMRKTGATDVAGALKFVVGTSVAQGKYATVRGLSDRYTGTTLNHVRVPSADPRRRAVQVDLFPTGTIENVTVTKTFTPDLEGDFTGGGIDIQTKSVPEEKTIVSSFGVEYNSLATGNENFLTYEGGGVNFFGVAGDDHALPDVAKEKLPPRPTATFKAVTPQQTQAAGAWDQVTRSFDPVMGVSRQEPGPNYSFSFVAGDRFDQGGGSAVGLMTALTYTHKYDFYEGGQNNVFEVQEGQPFAIGQPRIDSAGLDEVLVGLLGSFVYKPGEHSEYGFRLIANQSAEDEARFQYSGDTLVQQNQALHYTERTIGSAQVHGKQVWPGAALKEMRLDWFGAYNVTRQDEPDVRFFKSFFDTSTRTFYNPSSLNASDNTRRIFRSISEGGAQAALDLTMPFDQWTKTEGRIKTGLLYDQTDRDYDEDSFLYDFKAGEAGTPPGNTAVRLNMSYGSYVQQSPDELWTDVFLNPERIGLASNRCEPPDKNVTNPGTATCSAHNTFLWFVDPQSAYDVPYTGDQTIGALYGMGDLPLNPKVRVIGGARYESTKMSIEPHNEANPSRIEVINVRPSGDREINVVTNEQARADIDETQVLPSVGVVYEIIPQMNLRTSWSKTIARPTFRELAPVATEEFLQGDEFVGNTHLTLSSITNYDLRWEWFRKAGEVLAASVFYKTLTDPIELISFVVSGRSFVQPVNYERGEVKGAEFEARFPLGSVAHALEGLVVGANYTIIDSEVDVPMSEQQSLATFGLDEPTRRLQGQPENLFNASVSYDLERLGISTGVFYNVVGETLATGAAVGENGGVPNSFETAYRTVDFTYTQQLVKGKTKLSVSVKAKNLFPQERESVYRSPDGDEVIKRLRDTATLYGLSFGLSW